MKEKRVLKLDIGCGDNKQPGWIGMDKRKCIGVDIIHDAESFPYPIKDNTYFMVLLSHLWEHIEPKNRIELINEIWRITLPGGQLLIGAPYATSFGAYQDPTHYPCPNEATFTYFDPGYGLYNIYKPKPWKIVKNDFQLTGNMEVVLEKIA